MFLFACHPYGYGYLLLAIIHAFFSITNFSLAPARWSKAIRNSYHTFGEGMMRAKTLQLGNIVCSSNDVGVAPKPRNIDMAWYRHTWRCGGDGTRVEEMVSNISTSTTSRCPLSCNMDVDLISYINAVLSWGCFPFQTCLRLFSDSAWPADGAADGDEF